jgi:CheY-like chemotaxis protein
MATTVLVVDDEPEIRLIVEIQLKAAGYHVLDAENGEAALELLLSDGAPVDVVLLDLSMPRISGREVLERLRAAGRLDHLPVIVLSAHATEVEEELIALGCQDCIGKPYSQQRLLSSVEGVLPAAA